MTTADLDSKVAVALGIVYASQWSEDIKALLIAPQGYGTVISLDQAYASVGETLPEFLLPFAVVDEASLACVVMQSVPPFLAGDVVRWFSSAVDSEFQVALLDTHPILYIASLEEELAARPAGLRRVLDQIGPAYEHSHLDKEKRPRDYVVRPVRIACQNVIVALGAIAQDSSFDGLSVPAWQTCEVPHVATHEANRALAALTLCDAFQNGGTLEIRFDRKARILHKGNPLDYSGHPEKHVPASLRRFGRTVGVALGADDPAAITPREARDLFLAITPMPVNLQSRVDDAVRHRGLTPERICFLLLSQVWREIEMDYILSTSGRASSILSGGANWNDRLARQAESEICRGAVMAGMLYRRLNAMDTAALVSGSVVRVVEDRTKGVAWSIDDENAAVCLTGLDTNDPVPWTFGLSDVDTLTVFPRTAITADVLADLARADVPGHKALLVPQDTPTPSAYGELSVTVLRCPDRLADIDKNIEDRLLKSRISRG